MAQGILEQRRFPPEIVNPAAKPAVDALRAWRYQAWLRARVLAFRRSVISPVAAFWAWLVIALHPAAYKLWRVACVTKVFFSATAEGAGIAVSSMSDTAVLTLQRIHFGSAKRLQASLVLVGLSVVVFTYGFYGTGLEVFVNGESLGFVYSQSQFENAVANVSKNASEILQKPFSIEPNATFRYSLVSRSKVFNSREVENLLFAGIPELKTLDVLIIDGEHVAGVEQAGYVKERLNAMLTSANSEGRGTASFVENVTVSRQLAPTSLEISNDEVDELLYSNILPAFYAIAEHGVTAYDFAQSHGMSEETLLAMNPQTTAEATEERELLVNYALPLIQVKFTRMETYTETVAYETKYTEDPTTYKGRETVVTKGVDGYNTIIASVSYVDGREYSRSVMEVENTLEPVTEVIAQGTLTPPTFIRPFYGKLSSDYGMRDLFNANRMHTGVDFAGPTGSPIVASCGGTVTFSGWKSGYGNCIIISHENGLSTLYGHNSKNLVKVGDKVNQGDLIGKVGSTGRSTGPHVHFEVRVNDKPVSPWSYIK